VDEWPEPDQQRPSPWPATLLAIVGGLLAVLSIRLEHAAVDFGACACLLMSWRLSGSLGRNGLLDHPLARPVTQKLLLAFAILTGLIGVLRVVRGG
jgi:hypothetical protein